MSAWLRRSRVTIAAYCASCGGPDLLSGDECSIINRATRLIEKLEQIEALSDLIGTDPENRLLYFRTAGELRFVLGLITKRQARAAA